MDFQKGCIRLCSDLYLEFEWCIENDRCLFDKLFLNNSILDTRMSQLIETDYLTELCEYARKINGLGKDDLERDKAREAADNIEQKVGWPG